MQKAFINFNQRCWNHDYRSRCIYLITILKSDKIPPFSEIIKDPASKKISPIVKLCPIGLLINEGLENLRSTHPQIRILNYVIMPDHLHFEIFVTEKLRDPLGSLIASFKSFCTKKYWAKFPDCSQTKERLALFTSGFNDKIALRAGSKDAFYSYISDNPRRYLVKKLCSDYFYHKLMIEVGGRMCGLYGNLFLLDNPVKSFVKISRDKSKTPDLDTKIEEWEETMRCGGVLVSPFINPCEKEYRNKTIALGNGLIIVVNYRFSERSKPYKELFDLCARGKLLIVSTEEYLTPLKTIHYSEAQKMNGIAQTIASLKPHEAKLHRRK